MARTYPSTWSLAPEATCPVCGTVFRQLLSDFKRGKIQKFCSKRCMMLKPIDRLWDRVDKSGGPDACWPFTGHLNRDGYGRFTIDGKYVGAHRAAWMLTNGPIPDGMHVLHNCPGGDNPACCNPAHMFLGTHADNMHDLAKKGNAKGKKQGRWNARLTEDDVRKIKIAQRNGQSDCSIAKEFGVWQGTIRSIRIGKTWRDVSIV